MSTRKPRDFSQKKYAFSKSTTQQELPRQESGDSRRRNPLSARTKKIVGLTIVTLCCIAIYALTTIASFVQIDQIVVEGLSSFYTEKIGEEADEQLASRRWWIVPQQSIVYFSEKELLNRIAATVYLNNLSIQKKYGERRIYVRGDAELSAFVLVDQGELFMVSAEGRLLTKIGPSELQIEQPLLSIDQGQGGVLQVGDFGVRRSLAEMVIAAHKRLPEVGITPNTYRFDSRDAQTLSVQHARGWRILLSVNRDLDAQLADLADLLQNNLIDQERISYVDLRIAGRAFIK